ncbi:MAG: hypothetical protein KJ714_00190, partial [Euryarchaeota archaeon]|nr:hypothetical protein [Euryarchaeota archaeon]
LPCLIMQSCTTVYIAFVCYCELCSAYPHIRPVLSDVQAGEGACGGVVEEHGGSAASEFAFKIMP